MEPDSRNASNASPNNLGPFTGHDAVEYDRMKTDLIRAIEKYGGYEPAVDDLLIYQIVSNTIYLRKAGRFLNSKKATELTYTRIADVQAKFSKTINEAIHQLAISRYFRLTSEDQTELIKQLETELLEGLKNATESND